MFLLLMSSVMAPSHSSSLISRQIILSFLHQKEAATKGVGNREHKQITRAVWSKEINGVPMFRLCRKMKLLNVELKKLNQKFFGGLPLKVQKAREDLEDVQRRLLLPGQQALLQKDKEKLHCFIGLSTAGPKTAYFHGILKVRNAKNQIRCLYD